MPHLSLDYSANVEEWIDLSTFCEHLRIAMIDTGVFPLAGVRVRAFRASHVSIADGNKDHGYIDISVRLRSGRDLETRKRATKQIFSAAELFLEPAMKAHSLALSFEMRDIDPELSPKTGTIRDHLKREES
ncbi:5-carboxymethyl-2-hydroxymuconate Delta-isomerase [Primorskyibacter sp. S87]|uniref:5-carboxymethyl-2-hydroxymuconate Delta-isomerase n=1 Tax=Primorskyibacter sp. S87 TaxID=3415126 RepID=UPI003C7CA1E1